MLPYSRRARPHRASRIPPKISVVVVVYDMPRQAMNTLYTLSRAYQRDVDDVAYEVLVVENLSRRNLRARKVHALGPEFRYLPRESRASRRCGPSRRGSLRRAGTSSD